MSTREAIFMQGFVLIGGIAAFTITVALFGGCPRPVPTPPPPHSEAGVTYCDFRDMGSAPVNADLCPGLTTSAGYQCVRCRNASACVDQKYQVYCVSSCSECASATPR